MRLQRYLLRELLTAFLLITLIVTSIVFAGLLLQYLHKYSDQLSATSVLRATPYIIPIALPITLPLSFLVACLLTYGRFTDDNEFLATQMGGVHPWVTAAPAVAAAGVLAVVTVLLNTDVIPFASLMKKEIARGSIQQMLRAVDDPTRDSFTFERFQMSWNGRDERGLKDVLIEIKDPRSETEDLRDEREDRKRQILHAERGRIDGSRASEGILVLDLDRLETRSSDDAGATRLRTERQVLTYDLPALVGAPSRERKGTGEMTAAQLYYKSQRFARLAGDDPRAVSELKAMREYETEYWKRIAMGLSPLAFAFVGVGLGLGGGRGSRMAAFLTAILVALPVYHPLLYGGANLARAGVLPAGIALNVGNVLLSAIGLVMLGRAAR